MRPDLIGRHFAGFAAACFADSVKDRAGRVDDETVVSLNMVRNFMEMIAVKVDQGAAFRTFEVKM